MDFLVFLQVWHQKNHKPANVSKEAPPYLNHQEANHMIRHGSNLPTIRIGTEICLKETRGPKKCLTLKPDGPFKELFQLFLDQGWSRLLQPETSLNAETVREFYTNALPENPHTDPFVFETLVRGRTIWFDREAIDTNLGNPFPLDDEGELDDFHAKQNKGTFDL